MKPAVARSWAAVTRQPAWLVAVVSAPLALALGRLHGTAWHLTGDYSHTELMVRSIPRHPPLVGVVGRFGTAAEPGAHPGPSMGYAFYPIYKAAGSSSWAMMLATTLLHIGAIVVAVAVARRVGGRGAAYVVLVAAAVLVRAQGVEFFASPWNVWLPFFAFLAFVILVWGVVAGDLRLAPWAVLLGSHAAQTHISYLPLVAGLLLGCLVWLGARARWAGRPAWAPLGRAVGWSALVGAVAWMPAVIDQWRHDPGNLRVLFHHFADPPTDAVGPRAGLKGFAGEFDLFGTWWRGGVHDPTSAPFWPGVVAMAALAAGGAWVAIRRRDRTVLLLQGTVGTSLLIGAIAITRIVGDFYHYVIRWMWVLSALTVGVSLWALWRGAPRPAAALTRGLARGVVVAGLVAPVGMTTIDAWRTDGPVPEDSALVGALAQATEPAMSREGRYLLRWHDPVTLSGGAFGLLMQWEKDGFHVGVDPPWGLAAQRWRVAEEPEADEVLWFVTGDVSIEAFRRLGWRELARVDVRAPEARAESATLRARLEVRLAEIGRPDLIVRLDAQYGLVELLLFRRHELPADVYEDVSRYNDLRLPAAVFGVKPCSLQFAPAPPGPDNPEVRPDCEAARATAPRGAIPTPNS